MPIYEFQCKKCGHKLEEYYTTYKETLICPNCQSKMYKIISAPRIINPRKDDVVEKIKESGDKKTTKSVFGKYHKREPIDDKFGERSYEKLK